MRLRLSSAALCHFVPLILVAVVATATPVSAQFREVPAGSSTSAAGSGDLVPTREPFVTPRTAAQQDAAEPAKPAKPAEQTPAQQPAAPVVSSQPTPALHLADGVPVGVESSRSESASPVTPPSAR